MAEQALPRTPPAVDVFISYQRGERDAVAIIAQRMVELRLSVWFDSALKPGGAFDEEIAQRLSAAKAVLTCWTPAAMASDWVRAEAALALQADKLVACLLEPVQLLPPFNLIHAEDLCTWAGQEDAAAWLKILGRIGDLAGRPGLATYTEVMRPNVALDAVRSWALANGDDALVDTVWHRVHQLEGENQGDRIAREKAEAAIAAKRRRMQAERTQELAKEREVRSGRADRTAVRRVALAVAALTVLLVLGGVYTIDAQRRGRALDAAITPETLVAFIAANHWHPIAADAQRRFGLLDAVAWSEARSIGSLTAIDGYLKRFSGKPTGTHLSEAYAAREQALARREAQRRLARLGVYDGDSDGATTAALRRAIEEFQYAALLQVTGESDTRLLAALDAQIADRVGTRPEQLKASRTGAPTLDDYRRIAARLHINSLVLPAIQTVESKGRGFDASGLPLIRFEQHVFSRGTGGQFDRTHPEISSHTLAPFSGQTEEWRKLRTAFELAPQAAYASTSFGMFGIMGFHAKQLGFETAAELARFLSDSEANQVEVFARFLEANKAGLLDALRMPNWTGFEPSSWEDFSYRYNGAGYKTFHYHEKLALAYRQAAQRLGVALPTGLTPIVDPKALLPQPRAAGKGKAIELQTLGEDMAGSWRLAAVLALAAIAVALGGLRRKFRRV
jgi:hypothetical protein